MRLAMGPGLEGILTSTAHKAGVAPRIREHFGDYELLEEIARGGMGIVFRARQRSLNRVVAVKVLLFGRFSSPTAVKRFRAEAESAASLHHPNIVGIHDVGEQDGQHYFSMDYIEGRNLAEISQGQALPVKRAVRYLKAIAQAVHYAHVNGVLHRDLKPSNIIVDATDQPRITDFGLAKRLGAGAGDGVNVSELTLAGQVIGSPSFMAPEQLGSRSTVGPAADVYSLGALLYHLLTGRPPFVAETVETILAQVLAGDPVSPRRLNPSVSRDLETVCLKALERDREARYASAAELADELGRVLSDRPILARPISGPQKLWRWSRRNPASSGLSVLVVALAGAFLVSTWISSNRTRQEAVRAVRAEQEAVKELRDSYLAQARAERRSGRAGQRYESLAAIAKATAIRPSLELRNEAIAALALPDARLIRSWTNGLNRPNVTYSPTLAKYAKLDSDGDVTVHDAATGAELAKLPSPGAAPRWVAGFSRDETLIGIRYYNDQNFVWDIRTAKPAFAPFRGAGLAYDPKANQFIVARADRTLKFYSADTRELVRSVAVPEALDSITVDSKGLVMGGFREGSPVFHVLDPTSGAERFALQHGASVASAAFSADSSTLAVGCYDKAVWIWDLKNGEQRGMLKGHDNNVVAVGFNHSGTMLASTSWDDTVRFWDTTSWRQVLVVDGTSYELRFDPSDRWLGHLEHGGNVSVLEMASASELHEVRANPATHQEAWAIALSPDGRFAVTGHTDGFAVWDMVDRKELFAVPAGACRTVMFAADGRGIITCGAAGLACWPLRLLPRAGHDELSVGWPRFIRSGLQFLYGATGQDGEWVAAANRAASAISVYEVSHSENRFAFTNVPAAQFVSASPDFRWIASGTWGGSGVKVMNVRERKLEVELPTAGSAKVAFSPDGRMLITSCEGYEAWQVGSWRKLYQVSKPDSETLGDLAFSQDSRWLAVVKRGREIALLRASTGEEVATLSAPSQAQVNAVAFSPDGTTLTALQADEAIQIWDFQSMRRDLKRLKLDWEEPEPSPSGTNEFQHRTPVTGKLLPFSPEELAVSIPPRSASTNPRLIDLSEKYNAPLTESWFVLVSLGNDLHELPKGVSTLAGTEFDVRGMVQLGNKTFPDWYSTNVTGIKIGQRCGQLQFLQATCWSAPDGTEIGSYTVHYADGTQERIPIRYGEEVRDWWELTNESVLGSAHSRVAWRGANPVAAENGALGARLFKTTWENPKPDLEVESLDFTSSLTSAAPFLMAITAER
jgi:eukaryotic-like serine/threonine-protein kinase